MQIKPTAITVTTYAIELTEAEARAVLVDPAPFQDDLRAALGDQAVARNPTGINTRGGKGITLSPKAQRRVAEQKARAVRAPRNAGRAFTKTPCAKCGRPIGSNQIARHQAKCSGPVIATAETN
jgi:hypothetical protein